MSLNDRNDWLIPDPAPGLRLEQIVEPVSVRAEALLLRSHSPKLRTDFVRYFGVAGMLAGLDYHFSNYMRALERLPWPAGHGYQAVRHEAVAWLNRIGQFHYFCEWARMEHPSLPLATPRIAALLPFRHKHAAHRSLDAPRRDDGPEFQLSQARLMSDLGGCLWERRPGAVDTPFGTPLHPTHFAALQIPLPSGHLNLVIEVEHPRVMEESYKVLETLLADNAAI